MANIEELYGPAMEITDQAEADKYFEMLVQRGLVALPEMTRAEAEEVQRENLAYCAGYYSNETRARVERLFRCAHPVFGSIAETGAPSPEQAFELGRQWAERVKKDGQQ